jgi:DNA polymerase III subunit delta
MQHRLDIRSTEGIARLLALVKPSPVWAISGDDPLLTGETADALREHFKTQGITERQVEIPDRSFDWKNWLAHGATGSLFADQRLMDLRLPTGKPGIEGSKAIQGWCASPPDTVTLLVSIPRADRTMLASSWLSAIDRVGHLIIVPEMGRSELPGWISHRLRARGLTATPDAISWICDQCEGNLIAAHQEILKLALHTNRQEATLTVDDVKSLIADVARFNPFTLGESILSGDQARALRMLRGLKAEGEPLPLLLWSVAEDLRMVARTQQLTASGRSMDIALREARIPRHKERLVAAACRRASPAKTWRVLRQAAEVDTMIKGLKADDPWVALERLALEYAVSSVDAAA